ncbi:MAG: FAD:protein FMN transferase [Ignavibacteriales bacterium]|nr:FAD:protein FMN transferase [Ignavibacteriales bacterium]
MGTYYSIKYVPNSEKLNAEKIEKDIDSILVDVNKKMSIFDKESEISRFNQYKNTDWFNVSDDLFLVIKTALEVSKDCGGVFDITVGPLVNLWGFGPMDKPYQVPNDEEINENRRIIGWQKLEIRENPKAIRKTIPKLYLDLAAIAKGFGVDKIAEYFESIEIKNYLVEIGGEVRTGGKNQDADNWKIGISTPDEISKIERVIKLENIAVATSGDYWNYFEENGVRYSHTIDPSTGRPITHKLASVSVINESCMLADAYATAINVLGPEKGFKFAEELNLSVFFIIRSDKEFIEKMTSSFKKYLVE